MPGDPLECRQHARRCAELAEQARTPDMRQTFLQLSDTWIRLAAELESAQAFLNAVNGLEITTPIAGDPSLPGDADPSQSQA
jgi:hypothetical protein